MCTSCVVQKFVIFSLVISFARSELYKVFDQSDINSLCDFDTGKYKLESDCAYEGLRKAGILKGQNGDVVCCKKISTETIESTEAELGLFSRWRNDFLELISSVFNKSSDQDSNSRFDKASIGDASRAYCKNNGWKLPIVDILPITNGHEVLVGQFPTMITIFSVSKTTSKSTLICGGSLISEKFVLTAAHCFDKYNKNGDFFIRMGRTAINLDEEEDKSVAVESKFNLSKVMRHPEYSSSFMYHDIALIELDQAVTFTNNIKPVCLEFEENMKRENRNFTITGYGTIDEQHTQEVDWMLSADVSESSHAKCGEKLNKVNSFKFTLPTGLNTSQVCAAGDPKTFNEGFLCDTCTVDAGGPLIYGNTVDHKYQLTGVASFGISCKEPQFPAVYTRVSSYIDWIEKIVWT